MKIYDARMILLMRHCIDTEVCDSQKEFLESIGCAQTNLRVIKLQTNHFTVEQILAACVKYKINANWVFGLQEEMKLTKGRSAIQNLKDAVRAIEAL